MLKNHGPDRNIKALTDQELYSAIRYREPDPNPNEQNERNGVVLWVGLFIVLAGCLSLLWFYWR